MREFYRLLCRGEEVLSCTLFFMAVVLVMYSALARLVKHPISWGIDVAQLLLTRTCLLGTDATFRWSKLVGPDLFTHKLSEKVQKAVTLAIQVIMLKALVVFIVYGLRLGVESRKRLFQTLMISYSPVTLSLPASSAPMSITVLLGIREPVSQLVEAEKQSLETEVWEYY